MKSTGNIKDIYDIIQEQKSIQICLVEEKSNVSSTYFKYKEICRSFAINWGYWKVQENFSKKEIVWILCGKIYNLNWASKFGIVKDIKSKSGINLKWWKSINVIQSSIYIYIMLINWRLGRSGGVSSGLMWFLLSMEEKGGYEKRIKIWDKIKLEIK